MAYTFNPLTGGMDHTDETIVNATTADTADNTANIAILHKKQ